MSNTKASVGDRIKLIHTTDKYTKRGRGDTGIVTSIDEIPKEITEKPGNVYQVWVKWDDGGRLALIEGEDRYKVIEENE